MSETNNEYISRYEKLQLDRDVMRKDVKSLQAKLSDAIEALEEIRSHQETLSTGSMLAYKMTGAWRISNLALLKLKGK